jgi:NADP-dependent alcohol dehydrogenase
LNLKILQKLFSVKVKLQKSLEKSRKQKKYWYSTEAEVLKPNGVYDQVKSALEGYEWEEFGGIPANPEYEVLLEALKNH